MIRGMKFSTKYAIEKKTWAEKIVHAKVLPYVQLARLNRPAGTYMLLFPCYWSMAITGSMDVQTMGLFTAGSIVMRSAGCTINDMWDADFDKNVQRTNKRPLAAKTISQRQALAFLAGQLSIGLGILTQLNHYSIALGAASLPLVATYPLMKRYINYPQAYLGLVFNWGALLGYSAILGHCDWSIVLPLYLGGVSWTMIYDTLYAHQDKHDDQKLGLKSTALTFGHQTIPILSAFAATSISSFALAGYMADLSYPFYIGLAASSLQLTWQLSTANLQDAVNLQKRFSSNKYFGGIIFASIYAGKMF